MAQALQIDCVDKLGVLIEKPKRIKILVGGRGSTKSTFVADYVLAQVANGVRACCGREYQNSIDDSVHYMLTQEIERVGFQGFEVQKTEINHRTGGKAFYKGLSRNITSLKGLGAQILWIEEGEALTEATLKILTASIRVSAADAAKARLAGEDITPPEIWITMNRGSSADPIARKFLARAEKELDRVGYYEDDMIMVVEINWHEIPRQWFLDSGLESERLDDEREMSQAEYDHKWNGAYNDDIPNSLIRAEWFDACLDAHKEDRLKAVFKPTGAKFLAHDPSDRGEDDKGLAVRHGSIITHVKTKEDGEIDEGCDWATSLASQLNCDWFIWDGDGPGTGLKRQVSDAFDGTKTKYHMFRGSLSGIGQDNAKKIFMPADGDKDTKPKKYSDTFLNNRSQYYSELARLMYNTYKCVVNGEYIDPMDMISFDSDGIDNVRGFRSEICRIPTKDNNRGLIQIMSKQDMARLSIKSPNMADSVMMVLFSPKTVSDKKTMNFSRWN